MHWVKTIGLMALVAYGTVAISNRSTRLRAWIKTD
jgi:hypothetical protein